MQTHTLTAFPQKLTTKGWTYVDGTSVQIRRGDVFRHLLSDGSVLDAGKDSEVSVCLGVKPNSLDMASIGITRLDLNDLLGESDVNHHLWRTLNAISGVFRGEERLARVQRIDMANGKLIAFAFDEDLKGVVPMSFTHLTFDDRLLPNEREISE